MNDRTEVTEGNDFAPLVVVDVVNEEPFEVVLKEVIVVTKLNIGQKC